MFLFPRREAPPEGRARSFLLHRAFRFSKRETKKERTQSYSISFEFVGGRAHPRAIAPNPKQPPLARTARGREQTRRTQPRNARGVMPDVSPEASDREVLKNSPFSKGEWPVETYINVGYNGVYEAFGTPAYAGLQSAPSKHLLALAYATGQHDELLAIDPESFLQRWKSMIDAHALLPAETGPATTNAYNAAMATITTEAAHLVRYQGAQKGPALLFLRILKATSGVFSLIGKARNLQAVVAGEVNLSGFPRRLKKITATGAINTARLRGLAARVGVRFPDDIDLSEEASVDWVLSLATLLRGVTLKAVGWLKKAHASSQATADRMACQTTNSNAVAERRRAIPCNRQYRSIIYSKVLSRMMTFLHTGTGDSGSQRKCFGYRSTNAEWIGGASSRLARFLNTQSCEQPRAHRPGNPQPTEYRPTNKNRECSVRTSVVGQGWRYAMIGLLNFLRLFVFLPYVELSVISLVNYCGASALDIRLNNITVIFLVELDNLAFSHGAKEETRMEAEEFGRVSVAQDDLHVIDAPPRLPARW